ncbi:MAG: Transcriptional regulator, XRE family [uncultured Thiotrichaceae bacterium]|uniref:Transcriptional regulator, XRE family n=1 Tax=uncultured Thiotrichaceae bacterium TaxID=298394 RepID=A0A6S6TJK4_9GAMM|nr:MAG: Transcriptional regulator, XRE family [uncultured Thiotrichaceae bacterium]
MNSSPVISSSTQKRIQILGAMIKAARLERKLSQGDLAERIGVSRPTIAAIEKGKLNVSIGTVFEAAHIVGLPLMGGAEDVTQLEHVSQTVANMLKILPAKGVGKKVELDDDF